MMPSRLKEARESIRLALTEPHGDDVECLAHAIGEILEYLDESAQSKAEGGGAEETAGVRAERLLSEWEKDNLLSPNYWEGNERDDLRDRIAAALRNAGAREGTKKLPDSLRFACALCGKDVGPNDCYISPKWEGTRCAACMDPPSPAQPATALEHDADCPRRELTDTQDSWIHCTCSAQWKAKLAEAEARATAAEGEFVRLEKCEENLLETIQRASEAVEKAEARATEAEAKVAAWRPVVEAAVRYNDENPGCEMAHAVDALPAEFRPPDANEPGGKA